MFSKRMASALTLCAATVAAASFAMADDDASPAVELDASNRVVSIYNDRNTGYNDLELIVDAQGAVQGAKYIPHGDSASATKSFSNAQIASGAILEEQQGVKALILTGKMDAGQGSGRWTIKYVANGLSGSYKTCDLKLQRDAQGAWNGMNAYTGAKLDTAKIITWSMGITTIEGICPK